MILLKTYRRCAVAASMLTLWLLLTPAQVQAQSGGDIGTAIFQARVFADPLIAVEVGTSDSSEELLARIQQFSAAKTKPNLDQLYQWAGAHENSVYAPSLFLNLGHAYFDRGYFTRSLESWRRSWEISKGFQDQTGKLVADAAVGQLSKMHARIGQMEELQALLEETRGRVMGGTGAIVLEHSADGYNSMLKAPEKSFKCGPMALFSIREQMGLEDSFHDLIRDAESTTQGTSLKQLADWSAEMGMGMIPVRKLPQADVYPVPSVVNWKLGHYAALVRKDGDNYIVKDPTFGSDFSVTKDALDEEASGFFLTGTEALKQGYVRITSEEASEVWGKGWTSEWDPLATDPCTPKTGGASCNCCPSQECESGPCPDPGSGMSKYSFNTPLASLSISDTPVGYAPAVGPHMYFTAVYNQREATQNSFGYGNLGSQWSHNWYSAIEDNPASLNLGITSHSPGGGGVKYTAGSIPGSFTTRDGTAALTRISTTPIIYERRFSDGSRQVYSHVLSDTGTERKILITASYDAAENHITYSYDFNHRLVTVSDSAGLETTITYLADSDFATSAAAYMISKITDPFQRSAHFYYDTNNRLKEIKDTLEFSSRFTYSSASGNANFITQLENPYGITTFEKESNGSADHRWIKATDDKGDSEMVEFYRDMPELDNAFQVPSGFFNSFHRYRNCLYWSKRAMKEAFGDLEAAHIYHFLHQRESLDMSRTLEHEKPPLAGRIFYKYPNSGDNREGSANTPIGVGRKLDNGADEIYQYEYNDKGKKTKSIDPLGRTTVYTYDANGIDLLQVNRVVDSTSETLMKMEYEDHLPTKITDAAGQDTVATYNSFGQLETVTNSLSQTVTYDYSTTGLLERVVGVDPVQYVQLGYDFFDRVTSVTVFPHNYTIRTAYDLFDRPVRITYPDGTTEESVYERFDMVRSKDRLDQWTQLLYSPAGDLHAVVNPSGETVQFDWCKCGALSRLVDAEGRITVFDYDLAGRLTRKELPDGATNTYAYEPLSGRLKSQTDPKGQVTNVSYTTDGKASAVSVTNVAAGTAAVAPVTLTYDAPYGRLETRTDGIGTTIYDYQDINPTDSLYGDGGLASVDGPWASDTITYTYDELGRKTQRQINGGANSVSVEYDALGRVESLTNPLDTFTYAYKPNTSMVTGVSSPAGGQTLFSYKGAQDDLRLDSIENLDALVSPLSKFSYAQDNLGRITEWAQQEAGGTSETYSAKYDKSSRLTEWIKSNAIDGKTNQWNWRFDKAGNRLSEQLSKVLGGVVGREEYGVNEGDQITEIASGGPLHLSGSLGEQGKITTGLSPAPALTEADGSFSTWVDSDHTTGAYVTAADWTGNTTSTWKGVTPEPQPSHAFEYDGNGNTTRVITTSADGLTTSEVTYEWDALDQLVAINKGSHRSEFTYDGQGRRVKIVEKENGQVENERYYLWEDLEIAEERGVAGNTWRMFFPQGEDYKTESQTFYAKDHLGSIRQATDVTNANTQSFDYDAYGNVKSSALNYTFQKLYAGHFYHQPSGLYLAPYRAYDPKIGKWLSRDPIGHAGGLNLYNYLYSSPINGTDPLGLDSAINEDIFTDTTDSIAQFFLDGPVNWLYNDGYRLVRDTYSASTCPGGGSPASARSRFLSLSKTFIDNGPFLAGATLTFAFEAAAGSSMNVTLSNRKFGHIRNKHIPDPTRKVVNSGVSRFSEGTSNEQLLDWIQTTMKNGKTTKDGCDTIFEHDLGHKIGTNKIGDSTSKMQVIIDGNSSIKTAFPI